MLGIIDGSVQVFRHDVPETGDGSTGATAIVPGVEAGAETSTVAGSETVLSKMSIEVVLTDIGLIVGV